MSEILLAKPKLPEGWIDVSVGEPHIVREILLKTFPDATDLTAGFPTVDRMHEYPLPTGYQPLVEFLQSKHDAPVIITNGAKQALGASFYALKRMGRGLMGMRTPYWALIPPLAKMHGIECVDLHKDRWDGCLCLSPNNPDGFMEDLKVLSRECRRQNIPLIHDAAYYTHVYLPRRVELKAYGDVQIYSISKMLGLSGLRLGYVVCPNREFYRYIQEYMESMTVGVSVIPQMFLNNLFRTMDYQPKLTEKFEDDCANALFTSKRIMTQVDPEILEVPEDLVHTPGMFGWFKVGPKCNLAKARINAIDGALFGVPGMVRMNLAFDAKQMTEIVERLNSVKGG